MGVQPCFKSILTDKQGHSELRVFYVTLSKLNMNRTNTTAFSREPTLPVLRATFRNPPPLWAQLQLWKLFINFLNHLDFKVSQCHGLWNYTSPFYFFCSPRHSHFKIATCLFLVFINVRTCVGQMAYLSNTPCRVRKSSSTMLLDDFQSTTRVNEEKFMFTENFFFFCNYYRYYNSYYYYYALLSLF